MRARVASSMPTPVSVTSRTTYGPGGIVSWAAGAGAVSSTSLVAIERRPPRGIASRALTARFRITCPIWPRSARTRPADGSSAVSSSTSSPIRRASIRSVPATTSLSCSSSGSSTWRRLKASSWLVRAAARAPAPAICLAGAEGGQLVGRGGRRVAGRGDLLDVVAHVAAAQRAGQDQLAEAGHARHQVVEVVRDPAGQLADRLHLLRLPQPLLALAQRVL